MLICFPITAVIFIGLFMNAYHQEQIEAIAMVHKHLKSHPSVRRDLLALAADYLSFRVEVDSFLSTHFRKVCTQTCYQNRLSACCSREGIITFFADIVVNVLASDNQEIENLISILRQSNTGFKCVYLTENGCRWKVKPIVCEMFLCDRATETILARNPKLKGEWDLIEEKRKQYTWPDRPVLFDGLLQKDANGFILVNRKMFQLFQALRIDSGRKCFFMTHESNIKTFK